MLSCHRRCAYLAHATSDAPVIPLITMGAVRDSKGMHQFIRHPGSNGGIVGWQPQPRRKDLIVSGDDDHHAL